MMFSQLWSQVNILWEQCTLDSLRGSAQGGGHVESMHGLGSKVCCCTERAAGGDTQMFVNWTQ